MTRKRAIQLAVEAIELHRRKYAVGYHAYQSGNLSTWTTRDFKNYNELTKAIIMLGMKDQQEIPLATLDVMEHNGRHT